jgi:sec-independent protein translocase protein TatA
MEIAIVAIIALLVLGPKKLPEAGRGIGKSMREFKTAIGGGDSKPEADSTESPDSAKS